MNRTYKGDNRPNVKPVERVELSEKHFKLRVIAAIVLAAVALVMLIVILNGVLTKNAGWTEIEVTGSAADNCSADFIFQYDLGSSGASSTVEYRRLAALYTEATERAYKLFCSDKEFESVDNLGRLNAHPNEEIELDRVLCAAFELLERFGDRSVYLAPILSDYNTLFFSRYDEDAAEFDPYQNAELAEYFAEIAAFAGDPGAIRLELLGGGRVRLAVSDEYLEYAKENGITTFVDFGWMKNAFIADAIAEAMAQSGYTKGSLSSFDGFTRNLDSGRGYSFNIFHRVENEVYLAGTFDYTAPMSIVYLRDHAMNTLDDGRYYAFGSGELRTPYIDTADGLCRSSIGDLVAYSREQGCAELMLGAKPLYIAESFDAEEASSVSGMELIWCDGTEICCTEDGLSVNGLYDDGSVSYGVRYVR